MKFIKLLLLLNLIVLTNCKYIEAEKLLESYRTPNFTISVKTDNLSVLSKQLRNETLETLSNSNLNAILKKIEELRRLRIADSTVVLNVYDKELFSLSTYYKKEKLEKVSNQSFLNLSLFTKTDNSILLISNNDSLLNKSIKESKLYKATDNQNFKKEHILLKSENFESFFDLDRDSLVPSMKNVFVKLIENERGKIISGISKIKDSTNIIVSESDIKLLNLLPSNIENLVFFDVNANLDSKIIKEIKLFSEENDNYFQHTTELGVFETKTNKCIAVNYVTTSNVNKVNNYRNFSIYKLKEGTNVCEFYKKALKTNKDAFLTEIGGFNFISEDKRMLEELIDSNINNNTLYNSPKFKEVKPNLISQFKSLIYSKRNVLNPNFKSSKHISILQHHKDSKFNYVNFIVHNNKNKEKLNGFEKTKTLNYKSNIIYFVEMKNHKTNYKDIIVQTEDNTITRKTIDNETLWSLKLDENIIGEIHEIDLFKNGKKQICFATKNKIHVYDVLGRPVQPFPIEIKNDITQPISIFDYDNTKNYRILITQGKTLVMFDKNGKRVKGFNYKTGELITSQPKHIKINSKDYIVFKAQNKFKCIDRTGKSRLNIKNNFNFDDNEIKKYNNAFIFKDLEGNLNKLETNGEFSLLNTNLSKDYKFDCTNKTFTSFSDDKLSIKFKKIKHEYGDFTAPKIFYTNSKIFITITDLQSQKVYIYNSIGQQINESTLHGISTPIITNLDNDYNNDVIVKTKGNELTLYRFN